MKCLYIKIIYIVCIHMYNIYIYNIYVIRGLQVAIRSLGGAEMLRASMSRPGTVRG